MVQELTENWSESERQTFTELLGRLNQATDVYERRLSAARNVHSVESHS